MKSCEDCAKLLKQAGLKPRRPFHPDDCGDCQLFQQRRRNPIPPGGHLAWSVFQQLTSPAVERFHLEADVFECLNLRLSHDGTLELIQGLDAIMIGIEDAKKELRKPAGK